MAGTGALQDLLNRLTVGEMDWRSGRVDGQLPCKVSGKLSLVGQKQLLELADIMKLAAIGQSAAGVHRQCVVKCELLPALGNALSQVTAGFRTISISPAAHDVEVLQGESRGVNFGVAGAASLQGAMFVELLANRDRAANIGLDRGYAGRGRRRF